MAGGIDWFRWHHGSVTDPKFGLIAKKAGARVGDVIAVWALVLESASANDDRGTVGKIDAEAIEFLLGLDDGLVYKILDAMTQRGLLGTGGRVESWDKRQPKREDDTAAERKRRQREREHEIRMAACATDETSRDVTQRHAEVTGGHDREEKSREDISPSLRSGESASDDASTTVDKKSKAKTLTTYLSDCKRAKAKPVPDDHHIRRWSADAGVSAEMLQIAWVKFRERYTDGEKGKGKRYKDWPGHFATAVKDNWFKLWFADDEGVKWTTQGLTCKTVLDAQMKQQEAAHAAA